MRRPGFPTHRVGQFLIAMSVLFLCLGHRALADDEPIRYPNPVSLVADQWTRNTHGAVEIELFSMDPALVSDREQLALSLGRTIELAFANNLDIQTERYNTGIASAEIKKAQGVFNTTLFSDATHGSSRAGVSSAIQNSDPTSQILETTVSYADVGLRKLIQTGTLLELKLDFNRFKSNSTWLILNPSYTTHLNLNLTHPLLKNGGIAYQTAPVRIARNLCLMSEDRWEAYVAETLLTVVQAYWDLSSAFQNLQVHLKSLELSRELLRTNEIHVRTGSMAPVDLLQSKTGVALREEEVVSARNLLLSSQDILKQLLNLPEAPVYSAVQVVPTDPPPPLPPEEEPSLESVLRMALQNRPEYRAAERDLQNRNIEIKMAENQLLPSLDFTGNIGLNGLSGTQQPVNSTLALTALSELSPWQRFLYFIGRYEPTPEQQQALQSPWAGQWTRSFSEMFHGESTYQWEVGLRFEMPLENTSAKASYRQAKMEAFKSLWTMRSLAQKILVEVKDAWRAIETNRQKIVASEATRNLAREQLQAENKRLKLGLSTSYQVLQMEEDYRNAEIKVISAKAEYWKAKARLYQATGTFLQKEGLLDDDTSLQGNS